MRVPVRQATDISPSLRPRMNAQSHFALPDIRAFSTFSKEGTGHVKKVRGRHRPQPTSLTMLGFLGRGIGGDRGQSCAGLDLARLRLEGCSVGSPPDGVLALPPTVRVAWSRFPSRITEGLSLRFTGVNMPGLLRALAQPELVLSALDYTALHGRN
jgi:hypothetical protein